MNRAGGRAAAVTDLWTLRVRLSRSESARARRPRLPRPLTKRTRKVTARRPGAGGRFGGSRPRGGRRARQVALDLSPESSSSGVNLSSARVLKTLRPLRLVSRLPVLQITVTIVIQATCRHILSDPTLWQRQLKDSVCGGRQGGREGGTGGRDPAHHPRGMSNGGRFIVPILVHRLLVPEPVKAMPQPTAKHSAESSARMRLCSNPSHVTIDFLCGAPFGPVAEAQRLASRQTGQPPRHAPEFFLPVPAPLPSGRDDGGSHRPHDPGLNM